MKLFLSKQITRTALITIILWTFTATIAQQFIQISVDPTVSYNKFSETTFTRITEGSIVNDFGSSYGCAWGDYNNDGYIDLFVANTNGENNFLYRNNGDGSFEKVNTGQIVSDGGNSYSGSWGDYDNDGDLDLFVANDGDNFLYSNNGNETFTKISTSIIVSDSGFSIGGSWADFDNDGDLDLFVANYMGEDNFLYSNNGDGTFSKITIGPVVSDGGWSYGSSWSDIDNDGDQDLFVANGGAHSEGNNFLYLNNGNGVFVKVTSGSIVSDGGESFGASWGDYDNDGDMDLFVTNGKYSNSQSNFLYSNNGNGTFIPILSGTIVSDFSASRGSSWGDFDNDGDLDILVTNMWGEDNLLYSNNGDGIFTKITSGSIVSDGGESQGTSWADYDNDGDLDIFIPNKNGNNFLYRNNGNSNHWINIRCVGTISNKSAIGAKVKIRTNINGNPLWQLNEITGQSGGGHGGQNSLNVEFGLGDATIIDSLVIEWPSGIVQILTNISVDQFVIVTENSSAIPAMMYEAYAPHNTESTGPFALMFRIWDNPDSNIVFQSGYIHYGVGGIQDSTILIKTTYDDSLAYLGIVPKFSEVTGTTELLYYISADLGDSLRLYWPEIAPKNPATMIFGPDTTTPIIHETNEQTDVHYLLPFDKVVKARVSDDRFGVTVTANWRIGDGRVNSIPMYQTASFSDFYIGVMSDVVSTLGDTVFYWITAADSSRNRNTTVSEEKRFVGRDYEVIADWENNRWEDWDLDGYITSSLEFEEWGNFFVFNPIQPGISDTMSYYRPLNLNLFEKVWLTIPMFYDMDSMTNTGYFEASSDNNLWTVVDTFTGDFGPANVDISLIPYADQDSLFIRFRRNRTTSGPFSWYMDDIILHSDSSFLAINNKDSVPKRFTLYQNFPNPFNSITTIQYDLSQRSHVKLIVYDLLGRKVKTLVDITQGPGQKSVVWNAKDDNGEPISSGIYVYKLETKRNVEIRKTIFLK